MSKYVYKRILLKISGEALKGKNEHGYSPEAVSEIVERIGKVVKKGAQVALVSGAGNIWRGLAGAKKGMDRVTADQMGMLATVMNGLCLRDAFTSAGFKATVMSAIPMMPVAEVFEKNRAIELLGKGEIVILAGGTGSPFFTTDTTAALRALETDCEAVLKATKVDGIYSADPFKDPNATRFETISYTEALSKKLGVMDSTAFSLCSDNALPIIVFNFSAPDALEKVLSGDSSIATVVKNV